MLAVTLIAFVLAPESIATTPSWSGTWNTSTSSAHPTLTLKQTGTTVTGHYNFCNGTISGTDDAGTLTGTWHQSFPCSNTVAGSGPIEFKLSPSGTTFSGTWAYATTPNSPVRWIGHRVGSQQTAQLGSATVSTPLVFPAQAGKAFQVAVKAVTIAGTTRTVTPTTVTCQAVIGSTTIAGTGPGGCIWQIPTSARGKQLTLTMTVTYHGAQKTYHQSVAIV
jgi:hypothetical protein